MLTRDTIMGDPPITPQIGRGRPQVADPEERVVEDSVD